MYLWPYIYGTDKPPRDRGGRYLQEPCWCLPHLSYLWFTLQLGHSGPIGNVRHLGTWKMQNPGYNGLWKDKRQCQILGLSEEQNIICTFFKLRILLKQNTALLSTVRPFVTGVISHISQIHKGINASLMISWSGDPSNPIYSESKSSWLSFKQRPDQTRPSSPPWPTWPFI